MHFIVQIKQFNYFNLPMETGFEINQYLTFWLPVYSNPKSQGLFLHWFGEKCVFVMYIWDKMFQSLGSIKRSINVSIVFAKPEYMTLLQYRGDWGWLATFLLNWS